MKFTPVILEQFRNAGATIRAAFTFDIAISFPKPRTKFKAIDVTSQAAAPLKQLLPRTQPVRRRQYVLASLEGQRRSEISELFPSYRESEFSLSGFIKRQGLK